MNSSLALLSCTAAALIAVVWGHAAMIIPVSRNSLDRILPQFAGGAAGGSTTCESLLCFALALAHSQTTCAAHGVCIASAHSGLRPRTSVADLCRAGTCANSKACEMGSHREQGGGGQPCLWWSQGCSIGCDYCITDPRHPDNNGSIPTKAVTGKAPHSDKAGFRVSYCENPSTASVLPKEYWSVHPSIPTLLRSSKFNSTHAP